jgi:nucleoside-diphosphate-sugar epimerase
MSMRVLVTGSAGLIGAAVMKELAGRMTVAGLDKRDVPREFRASHYRCDILDVRRLREVVNDFAPDAVIHLAARTDLDESRDLRGYAANMDGVANLLEAIRAVPSVRRCIWTSTQLVCRAGYVPRDELDYQPDTLYGMSKVQTEKSVRESNGGGREWCLVRPTTVWGPGMSPHYQHLLSLIKKGRYFHVGRTPLLKSYGYVGNVAYQYRRLLEAPSGQVHARTFYLADYQPIDLIAWCNALQRGLSGPPIPSMPRPLASVLARVGDVIGALGIPGIPFNSFRLRNIVTEYQFDTSDIREVCGPLPYSTEQGVAETVAWFSALSRQRESA